MRTQKLRREHQSRFGRGGKAPTTPVVGIITGSYMMSMVGGTRTNDVLNTYMDSMLLANKQSGVTLPLP